MKRALKWIAVVLVATPLLYLLAAVTGALIPRNAGWSEPEAGVLVFVRTNGVHADLVLPAQYHGIDWLALLPADHVRDPTRARNWIAIGWGQREFYLETERWADLTARTAVRALTGGDPLMHVAHLGPPTPSATHRPLRLTEEAYARMSAAVARSFRRAEDGSAIHLHGEGYGENDTFYEAHGTYHAFRTSNQWTSDILAHAGVRIGAWTPFEQGIMWRFRDEADERDLAAMR